MKGAKQNINITYNKERTTLAMRKNLITKTAYLRFLSCPEEFWIYENRPDLIPAFSSEAQFKVEQGNKIDKLAQLFFKARAKVLSNEELVIFQKKIDTQDFAVIADVVIMVAENTCELYEVKAATGVKKEHIDDVAFQKMVFESVGLKVQKSYLVHVNKQYEFEKELDLNKLFAIEDITDKVLEKSDATISNSLAALHFAKQPKLSKKIRGSCPDKAKCIFVRHFFPELPAYSVFNIARLQRSKLQALLDMSVLDIHDVPSGFKLSDKQRLQVDIAQKGRVEIKKEEISAILNNLSYPLYFLDYETFSYVIPPQAGLAPYQQMVFQYSLHIIPGPGEECQHSEFLMRSKKESVENVILSLKENIHPSQGTIIVWNDGFEKPRNKEMAVLFPEHGEFLSSLNDRVYDLMKIFSDGLYIHPDFKGSASIKKVLPVLCPALTYTDLAIQNGSNAIIKWHHATDGRLSREEKEEVFADLLAYCQLDTLAMVKIWEKLKALS